jgi:hypothetical protein
MRSFRRRLNSPAEAASTPSSGKDPGMRSPSIDGL